MRSIRRTFLAASLTAALVALPTAASAGERPDHAGRDDRGSSTWTEDNDTNDGGTGNNVADDGDNAHPSGKDRSVEHGDSGNQGKATSDPDDDGRGPDRTNGGPDKANGAGGVDEADQDGNNGCGSDDDFEDDNEGWCGKRPRDGESSPAVDQPKGKPAAKPSAESTDRPAPSGVRGGSQGSSADTTASATCPATSVMVTSTKDLSNVVLVFADGDPQKFDGLSGRSGSFAGTGSNAGERIVRVYVKSGANASGEGPGYGERHDVACSTTTGQAGTTTTTSGGTTNGDTLPTVAGRTGERPVTGRPAPVTPDAPVVTEVLGVVLERPAAPAASPAVLPALDVLAAGDTIEAAPAVAGDALPRTGTDTGRAALIALLALLGGAVAVRRTA